VLVFLNSDSDSDSDSDDIGGLLDAPVGFFTGYLQDHTGSISLLPTRAITSGVMIVDVRRKTGGRMQWRSGGETEERDR
jgi:hypothetical protein